MRPALRQQYPDGRRIADAPAVFLFEAFLSEVECDHLIALAEPHLTPSLVSGEDAGVKSEGRTGGVHWVAHDTSAITAELCARVATLVGLPLEHAESLQVINYGPGQRYRPHYDAWEAGTETGDRCLSRGGQRLLTCLCYLNAVDAGGGTFFPRLDIEVMPKPGRMLLFHNCHDDSDVRHPDSLHGGMPPESGTKWACNIWFREQSLRPKPVAETPGASTKRF